MIKGPSLPVSWKKSQKVFLKMHYLRIGEIIFWQVLKLCNQFLFLSHNQLGVWQRTEISIIGSFFLQGFDFFPEEMTVLCPSVITFIKMYLCYIYILDGGFERFKFLKSRIYFHHDILLSHVKKETSRWSISN